MATLIQQKPLYNTLPVGQDIIFVISNNGIVSTKPRVKFIAEVHISSTNPANQNTATDLIGTFKTTPNNAGVGIFDLSSVVESYVKSENLATTGSTYKGMSTTATTQHPLHLIDKFSGNDNTIKYLTVRFLVEYFDDTTNAMVVSDQDRDSEDYKIFNGYLTHSNPLEWSGADFGYDISRFEVSNATTGQFFTNAPITQYANVDDYGTVAFLTFANASVAPNGYLGKIEFRFYDSTGSILAGGPVDVDRTTANGAYNQLSANIKYQLIYFGCYPANIKNWNSTIKALFDAGTVSYYTMRGYIGASAVTQLYTINVNCPDLKNYESIRLAWLNQWGAWDYYTFTKKSVRSLSTKGSTYTQQSGTWNESRYRVHGYKGGMKSFRVNATEKIKMNTDFVNEADSVWFEELINSPEVYVLEGYQTDLTQPVLNEYVTPVRLLTSSYTRKTVANDKLMQYTFEVEKSKTLRTQSV